jgi:cardiolipin synthase
MDWLTSNLGVTVVVFAIPLVMVLVVPRRHKPSTAIAWLLVIALFPVLGLIVYLLFGGSKLPPHRREQQAQTDAWIAARVDEARQIPALAPFVDPPVPERYQPFARLNAALGSLPVVGGNQIELITRYGEIFRRLVLDIDQARHYAHVEFFALTCDAETEPVFSALERAAARGVTVRVLMDHLGSMVYASYRATLRRLRAAGIDHHLMLPINPFDRDFSRFDLRNHRKLVVIDGAIGYTGSVNLIRQNYFRDDSLYYDELVARVQGPAALQLQAVFMTDWRAETGLILPREPAPDWTHQGPTPTAALAQVVPSGPGYANANNLALFTALVYAAQRELVMVTPYFIPDESLLLALTTAAQRGVTVTLINSAAADQLLTYHAQRSYYDALLRAGVHIYLYHRPALLHAKTIRVDDEVAVIGSSNLDIRSFQLNLEVTLVVPDRRVAADLRRAEAEYLRRSTPIDPTAWPRRAWTAKVLESVARLTAEVQ